VIGPSQRPVPDNTPTLTTDSHSSPRWDSPEYYLCYNPIYPNTLYTQYKSNVCKRYTEARSCNYGCSEKKNYYVFRQLFVALGIQHAMRMRHSAICGLYCSTTFFHILSKTARYSKTKILHIKCVFKFSLALSQIFLISRRTERNMIKLVHWSSCKVPVILVRF
jgi:hypothetical protein